MGVFSGFVGWIIQSIQQSLNAESKRSENFTENDTNNVPTKVNKIYYDKDEELRQFNLWRAAEKKHPWYDAPPKVKASKSRKVLKEDGPRQIVKLEKAVAWDFLWWSGAIPISLIVDENKKDLTAKYKKEKMMFMKMFEGNSKVEPIYVDQGRLCKHNLPKSVEEYKKCSGGQGKVASKVIMDQYFQPYPLLDLPPVSWYIRETTIKTTTILLQMIQTSSAVGGEI